MLAKRVKMMYNIKVPCRRDGMADVTDSKSVGGDTVWVQVPPPAPSDLYYLYRSLFVFLDQLSLAKFAIIWHNNNAD